MTLKLDVLILPVQTAGTVKDFRGFSSVPRSARIMVCPRGAWTWGMLSEVMYRYNVLHVWLQY